MEALEQVVDFVEASTLGMDFPTKVFVKHTTEMVGLLAEDIGVGVNQGCTSAL